MLLEKDGAVETVPSRAVWLQTNFFVGSDPDNRETFINIALGEWDPVTRRLTGAQARRIDVNRSEARAATRRPIASPATSPAWPARRQCSHFLGTGNPNLVIGLDSTGTHNIGRDNPLNPTEYPIENQSGATYHIGVGAPIPEPLAQTGGTFQGYAAGFAQQPGSNSVPRLSICRRATSLCLLNAATNTMTASLHLGDGDCCRIRNTISNSAAQVARPLSTTTSSRPSRPPSGRVTETTIALGRYQRHLHAQRSGLSGQRRCDRRQRRVVRRRTALAEIARTGHRLQSEEGLLPELRLSEMGRLGRARRLSTSTGSRSPRTSNSAGGSPAMSSPNDDMPTTRARPPMRATPSATCSQQSGWQYTGDRRPGHELGLRPALRHAHDQRFRQQGLSAAMMAGAGPGLNKFGGALDRAAD